MAVQARNSRIAYGTSRASAWLKSFNTGRTAATYDATVIEDEFEQSIRGTRSWEASGQGLFRDSEVSLLSSIDADDDPVLVMYAPNGWDAGRVLAFGTANQSACSHSASRDDLVAASFTAKGTGTLYNGVSLAAGDATVTDVFATGDNGAATAAGAVCQLHVLSNTLDGSAIFEVEHSTDGLAWVALATFSTVPAEGVVAQQVAAAGTVHRYVRVTVTTEATTGAAEFVAAVARG